MLGEDCTGPVWVEDQGRDGEDTAEGADDEGTSGERNYEGRNDKETSEGKKNGDGPGGKD